MNIQARDIIGLSTLMVCFGLIAIGKNSYLYPIVTLIVGYYFSKRVYEERNNNK